MSVVGISGEAHDSCFGVRIPIRCSGKAFSSFHPESQLTRSGLKIRLLPISGYQAVSRFSVDFAVLGLCLQVVGVL